MIQYSNLAGVMDIRFLIIFIFSVFLFSGCTKSNLDDDTYKDNTSKNNDEDDSSEYFETSGKLKQISFIHFIFSGEEDFSYEQYVKNPEVKWNLNSIYKYDNLGRISKVSSPMYADGRNNEIISYDTYKYNSKDQLEEINYFCANLIEGFINLRTTTYLYDNDGNKIKKVIEYPKLTYRPQTDSTLYYYENNLLKREDIYSDGYYDNDVWGTKLIAYFEYEYDDQGNLIKESSYSGFDNSLANYKIHSYQNGLNVKTEVFNFYNYIGETKDREIRRHFDEKNNLIYLESQEISMLSSSLSYIEKYEYYK